MSPQEAVNKLHYLLLFHPYPETVEALNLAIAALEREAKAEPVAWLTKGGNVSRSIAWAKERDPNPQPLYIAPPAPESE